MELQESLLENIKLYKIKIGIMGLGYVGLPLASAFLRAGYEVIGFDVDIEKIKAITSGQSYISTVPEAVISEFVSAKKFSATNNFARLNEVGVIIICVPTPLTEAREPDISYIESTAHSISKSLCKGQIIVLESTTWPGTTEEIVLPILSKGGLVVGKDFFLGFSPEREDPGNKHYTTTNTPKIVSGVTPICKRLITTLYEQVITKVIPVSSTRIAELTKLTENIYRSVNIALVNELKLLCHRMELDVHEVLEAASSKPFGFQRFTPGPGLGGHCIPLDPFYLTWKAREFDFPTRFIELAGEVNTNMPYYVVQRTSEALNKKKKSINGSSILVLGVAYKKDINDMRESPALKILELLHAAGASIAYHDPFIPVLPKTRKYNFPLCSIPFTKESLDRFDCAIVITDHTDINYQLVLETVPTIVDTRNVFSKFIDINRKVYQA